MKLASLIKNSFPEVATATIATIATEQSLPSMNVANVADVAVADALIDKNGKWAKFMDECLLLGVTEAEVVPLFPAQDKTDLLDEPREKLPLHAESIANAIKAKRMALND